MTNPCFSDFGKSVSSRLILSTLFRGESTEVMSQNAHLLWVIYALYGVSFTYKLFSMILSKKKKKKKLPRYWKLLLREVKGTLQWYQSEVIFKMTKKIDLRCIITTLTVMRSVESLLDESLILPSYPSIPVSLLSLLTFNTSKVRRMGVKSPVPIGLNKLDFQVSPVT